MRRKFYYLMAAIVALFCVSFTANATGQCYVYGSGSGLDSKTWDMTEIKDSKGNGLDVWYKAWNFTGEASFRIQDDTRTYNWSAQNDYGLNSSQKNKWISADVDNQTHNFTCGSDLGNVVIIFDRNHMQVMVRTYDYAGSHTCFVCDTKQGSTGTWTDITMTDDKNGLRYYTLQSAIANFKFKKSGTWDNSIGGGSWSDTDWPYVASESNDNINASIAAGETINLHYYTGLVFITGHYTYNKPIFLLGGFTNWHDYGDPSSSYKFTQTAQNIWWLKNLNISTNTEFKIFNYNTGYENATRYLGNEASGISPETRYQIRARDWSASMTNASTIKSIKLEYDTEDGLWYMTYYTDDIDTSVIQYVRVVEKSSGNYITLKSSNGTTWTGSGTINSIVSSPSSGYDSYRYYISTSTDGSTWTNWVPSSTSDSNYWLSPASTKTLAEKGTNDYYFCFKTGATSTNGEADVTVTITLNDGKTAAASMSYIVGASATGVNMPLKASDFAGGKSHYFLVGVRTAGWRLLPEWELTDEDGDGVYELKDRLVYNGHFGIARVDSYEKYILHQYDKFYSNNGSNINSSTTQLTLNASTAVTGCVTDKTTTNDGTTFWNLSRTLTKSDVWGAPTEFSTSAYEFSMPCYVEQLTFTPASNGESGVFKVAKYTTNATDVASHLSFTFVGSGIRYDNDGDYNIKGKGWYTNASGDGYGWGDSWYSWDANGKPYIDGYGKPIYLTAYNQEWLSKHPAYFYDETKNFYYSSDNLTFVHYTDLEDYENDEYINVYKAHPAGIDGASSTIPAKITTSGWNYQEVFENSNASETSYTRSDWQCFVVKDVWLRGDFKVWTGWGGASSLNEKDQAVDQARWYTDNGGHNNDKHKYGVAGYDLAAGGDVHVYGTKRDKYAADFRIVEKDNTNDYDPQGASEMQFYNRAILWYNPNVGFNGSVIQLIQDTDGPMIQAQRKSGVKNKLQYRWSINAGSTERTIAKVTITRYVYKNGAFVAEKSWDVTDAVGKKNTNYGNAISTYTFTDDSNTCEQGAYYYGISVLYSGYTSPKTATSNRIIISYAGTPVSMSAAQMTNASSQLRLGVTVTVTPKDDVMKKDYEYKAGELINTTSTIANVLKGYYLVAESASAEEAAIADKAAGKHDWKQAPAGGIDTYAYADPASSTTETVKIAEDKYYLQLSVSDYPNGFTIDMPRAAANKGVNVSDRDAYTFSAYLLLDDGDTTGWKELALGQATATTDVELPAPAISHSGLTIQKNTDRTNSEFNAKEEMPVGALGYDGEIQQPVKYTNVNELVLPITLTDDNLADEVFTDGININYIVNVYDNNSTLMASKTISSDELKFSKVNIYGNLRYLPVDVTALTKKTVGTKGNYYYALPEGYNVDVAIQAVDKDTSNGVSSSTSAATDKVAVDKISEGEPAGFTATLAGQPFNDGLVINYAWTQEYYLRHGAVKYETATSASTEDIIQNVKNSDLYLYLGQSVKGCSTEGYDGSWQEDHGANGGSYVPAAGWYKQDENGAYAGLTGYVEYNGTYDDSNNWAKLAADQILLEHSVPLQVIPLALGTPAEAGKGLAPVIDNGNNMTVGGGDWVWYVPVYTISDETGKAIDFAINSLLIDNSYEDDDFNIPVGRTKAANTYSIVPFGVATSSLGNFGAGATTGVESVGYDAANDAEAVYYNLQGVRILNPAKGQIYLRVVGNTATKVLY